MDTIHVRPGEGRRYAMIDGDHVAKAAVQDEGGAFEVFEVIATGAPMAPLHVSVSVDRPIEDSMPAIRSVTRRHGVALASA